MKTSKASRAWQNVVTISSFTMRDPATISLVLFSGISFRKRKKKSGQDLLPVAFMRRLIGFYGDAMQEMVPAYLERSIETLTREREKQRRSGSMLPNRVSLPEDGKLRSGEFYIPRLAQWTAAHQLPWFRI